MLHALQHCSAIPTFKHIVLIEYDSVKRNGVQSNRYKLRNVVQLYTCSSNQPATCDHSYGVAAEKSDNNRPLQLLSAAARRTATPLWDSNAPTMRNYCPAVMWSRQASRRTVRACRASISSTAK